MEIKRQSAGLGNISVVFYIKIQYILINIFSVIFKFFYFLLIRKNMLSSDDSSFREQTEKQKYTNNQSYFH